MNIYKSLSNFVRVAHSEMRLILHDSGVILILFGVIFIYSTLYSLAYYNQVVQDVPIAVIDDSNTPASRLFCRDLNASPNVEIAYKPTNMTTAKHLFYSKKVYGVVYIPQNYEKDILSGGQAVVGIYADASYFLMYKQLFSAAMAVIGERNISIEERNFMASGMSHPQAVAVSDPVKVEAVKLFNRVEGYAFFVMPAIMLLILQQVVLMGIGMVGGTMRERGLYDKLRDGTGACYGAATVVFGKALAYFSLLSLLSMFIYGLYYKLFGYPAHGKEIEVVMFFVPYILSSVMLAIALSTLFQYRETAIYMLAVWSIPFLLLSGVSYPVEGIPAWLVSIGKAIPSSSAIDGFIKLQLMGSSLNDVFSQYRMLWILSGVYSVLAIIMMYWRLKREQKI